MANADNDAAITVVVSSFFIINVLAVNGKIKWNNANIKIVDERVAYY